MSFVDVCSFADLVPGRGVAALVGAQQIAIFRVGSEVFALGNRDPFSGANVMSRGIVGSKGDVPKVASPMYKNTFDLRTGTCLEDPSVSLPTFDVRVRDGRVEVIGS
jgi:nitrite reductase (NADH) small subunit